MKFVDRRTFLGTSAIATAGLILPAFLRKNQQEDRIGVALLGLGGYSTYQLAPALRETKHCYLAGIVTGSPEKIPNWQKRYKIPDANVYSYDSMSEIADNDSIDVIYIVTPTGTHADFVIKAAETGKHVWCEKPMAMTVHECQKMINACASNRVKLTLGYRVQHEPNTLTVNGYAVSKPFGRINSVESAAGYAGGGGSGWRFDKELGGGALYDMGVYTVNGIRNAINQEPLEVISARQYTDRPRLFKEVDETTEYQLRFQNDINASGKTSVGKSYNYLKVTCEKGWYELRPMQTYNGVKGRRSDGIQINEYLSNQQAKQMDDDALALLEDRDFVIQPEEGLKDIRIIEAIIKSAKDGQPIKI